MGMSLADLKAANQAKENEPEDIIEEVVDEITETEEIQADSEEVAEVTDEVSEEESPVTEEIPNWMQADTEEKQGNADFARQRIKYKGKLDTKNEALDLANKRIQELEQNRQQPQQSSDQAPKLDDFYDSPDPDAAYLQSKIEHNIKLNNMQQQAQYQQNQQQYQQRQQAAELEKAVDEHYTRAASLSKEAGISSERYQNSDFRVRSAVDSVFQGNGDSVVDNLIANLGDGSQRVIYNLGVNNERLSTFIDLLKVDPSGLKASMYLGKLNGQLSTPRKAKSNAPKPTPSLSGDGKVVSASEKGLKKAYQAQSGATNLTERFRLRKEGKAAGYDVSNW